MTIPQFYQPLTSFAAPGRLRRLGRVNVSQATLEITPGQKFYSPDNGASTQVRLQIEVNDKAGHFSETYNVVITVVDGSDTDPDRPPTPAPGGRRQ